jgi:hypothetical protein
VDIVPKRCFQKVLGSDWQLPQLVETFVKPSRVLRAS